MERINRFIDEIPRPIEVWENDRWIDRSPGVIRAIELGGYDSRFVWENFSATANQTGYMPVLLGSVDDVALLEKRLSSANAPTVSDVIRKSQFIDPKKWFSKRLEELTSRTGQANLFPREEYSGGHPGHPVLPVGIDPVTYQDQLGTYLGLIPTAEVWTIPAYLLFGDGGDFPPPEVHVALWKYWNEIYSARIYGVSHDTLEFVVDILDEEDCDLEVAKSLELAKEHILYCPSLLAGELNSLDRLAVAVWHYSDWRFRWR